MCTLRQTALCSGGIELIFFSAVFLSPNTLEGQKTISANLFDKVYFRVFLSFLVFLQQIFCTIYCLGYKKLHPTLVALGVASIFSTCVGWAAVISFHPQQQSLEHNLGAGIFMICSALTYIIMLRLVFLKNPMHPAHVWITEAIFLVAFLFTLIHIILFFTLPATAWMWENLGFAVSVAGYLLFFWYFPFEKPSEPYENVEYPLATQPLMNGYQTQIYPLNDKF